MAHTHPHAPAPAPPSSPPSKRLAHIARRAARLASTALFASSPPPRSVLAAYTASFVVTSACLLFVAPWAVGRNAGLPYPGHLGDGATDGVQRIPARRRVAVGGEEFWGRAESEDVVARPELVGCDVWVERRGEEVRARRFRLVVLAMNRGKALRRLLESAKAANYSGAGAVDLDIFIDRAKDTQRLSDEVVKVSREFQWPFGVKTVAARREHVGLVTQWIETWQPGPGQDDEAVLLEDDLELSPHFFQWLASMQRKYGARPDVAGYTLQRGRLRAKPDARKSTIHVDERHPLFMYRLMGSWGFAPRRETWMEFRAWYHRVAQDPHFKPYVPDLLPTQWYKGQEGKGTMWTMHYIYFCNQRNLFTVYANLPNRTTLASNWQESGLHYSSKVPHVDFQALPITTALPASLPDHPIMLDWDGHPIQDYYSRNRSPA